MSEPEKSTTAKPIIDVEHPGKSAPADTSRSIITHRPILKDPMMIDENASTDSEKKNEPKLISSSNIRLQPGNTVIEDKTPVKTETEAKPEPVPEPPPEPEVEVKADPEPDAEEKVETETKKQAEAEVEDEAAKQAEHEVNIQKVVDSKKYFLPINSVEKRRSARFVALGIVLSLLLAMAWVDVALDAGLIHLGGVKPLTHFFSN
jgi:cytoskeletal protein RodZ